MKTNLLILFTVLCFISCKEEIPSMKQKIYFEMHYVNYAWLPQSSGYLIDSLGNVLPFKWVEVFHEWYEPDSTAYISSINMDKNISFCQTPTTHIHPDTLKYYVNKIYAASKGSITKPQMQMADFGDIRYSAFIYDEKTNRYKEVLIKLYGDLMSDNNTPEAAEIYQWMNRIGK
ncbi:MAG: hypothetical protein WCG08_06720 [Paludibacter sp.]|jgi:hypothetical protein